MHTRNPSPRRGHRDHGLAAPLNSFRSPSGGFTVLEVMFAATIMALSISTSIITLQRAFLALDSARKMTLAGQMMQSEFEKIRMQNWTTVNAYPASADITASVDTSFAGASPITRTFVVTRSVSNVHTDMKMITLTTSWRSYDGRSTSRSYSTYYGKDGLYDYYYNSY